MAVFINPRSTWAPYVNEEHRAHAAAPPDPTEQRDWTPQAGGVFIHYRGGGGAADLKTEEDCRADIAEVYEDYRKSGGVDEDRVPLGICYNFVICMHGNVYEGRGYERGEANAPGYVGGLGSQRRVLLDLQPHAPRRPCQ